MSYIDWFDLFMRLQESNVNINFRLKKYFSRFNIYQLSLKEKLYFCLISDLPHRFVNIYKADHNQLKHNSNGNVIKYKSSSALCLKKVWLLQFPVKVNGCKKLNKL